MNRSINPAAGPKPLSDLQSLQQALAGPLKGAQVIRVLSAPNTHPFAHVDWERLRQLALAYNPSADYAEFIAEAYRWVHDRSDGDRSVGLIGHSN